MKNYEYKQYIAVVNRPYTELERKILVVLATYGGMHRDAIADLVKSNRTTTLEHLVYLKQMNEVVPYKVYTGNRGKPKTYWKIKDDVNE